ncbi:HDIG domain-containing protein, partial [Oscillatoriales cyanobacterium LEGE 11467]
LLGGVIAGRLRCREELALLGLGVGFTQGIVYLIVNLIMSGAAGPVWTVLLGGAGLQAMLGVSWSVVALGLSPYLEHLFDLVTPIRLAELSNPNRPLLKRLASEAPGTFQHTLFVATLAEATARELGCNVELVRAGTLYHDIGKMHDPLGFVENQMGGPNKHDSMNNPWLSAKIIKKHVSEGLVMAKKARLPKAIQAFIPEHQGTMQIAYFYYQAKQNYTGQRQVREEDFRYPGPIPQSRETGIVMLADSCEAALRSLEDATTEEALAMVNKILRARWKDEQLVDSGLTRADMSQIAEIFVRVWQQFNHKRIAYPKAILSPACQGNK